MNRLAHLSLSDQIAIADFVDCVQREFPSRLYRIVLFGSKARGDDDVESDIDLLAIVDDESGDFQRELWRIAYGVLWSHEVVISVRVYSMERWIAQRQLGLPFVRNVEAEGISLPLPELTERVESA